MLGAMRGWMPGSSYRGFLRSLSRGLVCGLLLAGCASSPALPVIQLTPEGPFEWSRGRALLHQHSEHGVEIQAAFERDRGDYLEWWIRIDNHSQRSLQVSPQRFFYRIAESERGGQTVTAIDPTRALTELAAAQARATAREADADDDPAGIDFLERVVDGMLGFDPPSPSEARSARDQQRVAQLAERDHQERWRDFLANRTVRRDVLRPGESVEGAVLFPRLAYPGRTELILIVSPAVARFRYAAGMRPLAPSP
ncbi:MAG: hypothetical protein RL685_1681 [Pseudomonadota bacterium]